jgi:ABC-type polysaccharide/polyol phosphate transport system ATPase subunit
MAHIRLQNAGLTFRVRKHLRTTLKDFLVGQLFRTSRNPYMEVRALEGIDLEVGQGERLGILGHNGAGKSTLLKLLAGVYHPTHGKRHVEGRISSLFDLVLGFEMDASGWDNIAYRSYLQGETPRTVRAKQQSIADFTELGDFLNMPVRYYSAGMMVRLAFAISTSIDPEILLVDEVLAVGDLAFYQKARSRMLEMMSRAHLMVMVSHDLGTLQDLCSKLVWLDHGKIKMQGPAREVIAAYKDSVAPAPAAVAA